MRVELFPPESLTEPRHWLRHDQNFAMMLGPGSIEWGSQRSALEKFDYPAGDKGLTLWKPGSLRKSASNIRHACKRWVRSRNVICTGRLSLRLSPSPVRNL
jgi:hypothetical protein